MVLQTIDLADIVTVRPLSVEGIRVRCDTSAVPQDQTNLAYRAAELMMQRFPDVYARLGGVEIELQKHIPMGAGLAGGSTDAAATLVGIDLMWQLGLTQSELQDLGAMLGSDVPFCISGGTAIATGRGEKLAPLTNLDNVWVVLAKYRDLPVSTPWAYKTYRQQFGAGYPRTLEDIDAQRHKPRSILDAIAHRDFTKIGQLLHNDLERVVLPEHPKIQHLRDQFQKLDVLGTMMSGSGSTVFAIVSSQSQAQTVQAQMQAAVSDPDLEFWITKFNTSGVRLSAT